MNDHAGKYADYFRHLKKLSLLGLIYHRFYKLPLLYVILRLFGKRIIEVGSGVGNGVLGSFSSRTVGLDVNPLAVQFCKDRGLSAELVGENGRYPFEDSFFDAVLLDNVLEHIQNPQTTLDECWRVTSPKGGLVIAVPGLSGFHFDSDHKIYYDEVRLRNLDRRWRLHSLFSLPFIFKSNRLSGFLKQYCLVAIYKKIP